MVLRVRQVQGLGLLRNETDETFACVQHRAVDRLAVKAFGCVELERSVHAEHIDRANLRHHVGGDQHDDLVETLLRADLLRHGFAESSQQNARTAEGATHLALALRPGAARARCLSNAYLRESGARTR